MTKQNTQYWAKVFTGWKKTQWKENEPTEKNFIIFATNFYKNFKIISLATKSFFIFYISEAVLPLAIIFN